MHKRRRIVGAYRCAGKSPHEIKMSKGNKEAKKPKRAEPPKTPGTAPSTPVPAKVSRPEPRKKWPAS